MNYDLVAAIIALIRASSVGTAVGGRIYQASQVPATLQINGATVPTPFPRCYISLRRSASYVSYNRRDGGVDRHQMVEVLFAQTTAVSATAFKDVESWDKTTRQTIEYNVVAPNLVLFQRVSDSPTTQQADDLNVYVMGGGMYDAFFQEG